MDHKEFLAPLLRAHSDEQGNLLDPDLTRRLQHPICQECHAKYQAKFPGKPFGIHCQGIFDDQYFQQIANRIGAQLSEVKGLLDVEEWAHKHVKLPDANGDMREFVAREYQRTALLCTARRLVDRWGRGLGKSTIGYIKELHKAFARKNYPIMIVCPAKAQAQMWYDNLNQIIDNDLELSQSVKSRKQQPFFTIEFFNGSKISIFTAGSQSGRDADAVRGQSPRRVRIDEQDLLTPGDYKAIMPLLRRFADSEFHGSSTPTGKRETYWEMCQNYPDYQEFHFPIQVSPDFSQEYEEACRREARTETAYIHEFLAEFGDQEGGVFKSAYVDLSKQPYLYSKQKPNGSIRYFMGVDWNGQGTGARVRIVGFDPATKKRRIVAHQAITSSNIDTINAIKLMNRRWQCEEIYVDAGFGFVQDELLRLVGHNPEHPADTKLRDIHVIDFGATIKTNKLVPNRGYEKYIQSRELERRTKPFMVEGAVMCLEDGLFEFSDEDKILDDQLRAYRVKTWSQHGYANTYEAGNVGDHDLDAVMLALLGIELKYGLFANRQAQKIATITHLAAYSMPDLDQVLEKRRKEEKLDDAQLTDAKRDLIKQLKGVPSRTSDSKQMRQSGILHAIPGGAVVGPPSRTSTASRASRMAPNRNGYGNRTSGIKLPDGNGYVAGFRPVPTFRGRRPL